MEVSEEKFEAFEEVRKSGQTNMFDVLTVMKLAKMFSNVKLTREEVTEIFRNYATYKKKYLDE